MKACEELNWSHERSMPHRSETNGIAERAVRRVKENTSSVLVQSGLQESWRCEATECYCYLQNLHDLLADGRHFRNVGSIHHLVSRSLEENLSNIIMRPPVRQHNPFWKIHWIRLERGPEGHLWVQGRLTKKHSTARPGNIGPEKWPNMLKQLPA